MTMPGLHSIERHPGSQTWPGIVIYRFDGPITFFHAAYFKQRALRAADDAAVNPRWFVLDMIPVSRVDVTGLYALRDLREELEARGTRLVFAGRRTEIINWMRETGMRETGLYWEGIEEHMFPTLRQALKAYRRQAGTRDAPPVED